MKNKKLFVLPLCATLLSGCSNISIQYYKSNNSQQQENNPNNQQSQNTNTVEDFYSNTHTTYTENITSTSLETLYQNCKKAMVTIETYVTYTKQGVSTSLALYSSGSGFIAKESENYLYIYTNAHVIDISNSASIQSFQTEVVLDNYARYVATIIASDGEEDVAIIRIDKPSDPSSYLVASLADSSTIQPGETVFAIGSPLGLDYASTITEGIISGVNVAQSTDNDEDGVETTIYFLQTDTALNPGNSGGALFNYNGEVVGVNTLKIVKSDSGVAIEGIGFAIPINHFDLVVESLLENGSYSRPQVGISAISVSSMSLQTRENYNISMQYGLYIDSVTNTNSNLIKNTIITHINNKQVYTFSDFASELYKYNVGDIIALTYCNVDGTNSNTINITLI